ncbi:MAG TPA: MauE/DoxX family redox-associated membrane protein [Chryseosolibacter sp.]|nr:MauE/DoxX family redox-associated membrane protein [Chryseosolibacter sp.]
MHKSTIVDAISIFLILLFVYAAFSKWLDFKVFQVQLMQSPMLTSFAPFLAWTVPATEVLIAFLLLINSVRLLGLYAAFSLMIMFTTYIALILNFSSFIPCSCGGILERMGWTEHLIFNLIVTMLAAIAIMLESDMVDIEFPASFKQQI